MWQWREEGFPCRLGDLDIRVAGDQHRRHTDHSRLGRTTDGSPHRATDHEAGRATRRDGDSCANRAAHGPASDDDDTTGGDRDDLHHATDRSVRW